MTLSGQLDTSLALAPLAAAFAREGVTCEVRESSHYTGGSYLRLRAGESVDFTLERVGDDEYLARGDAEGAGALTAAAQRVSAALARMGIRHRFELYEEDHQLAGYQHHCWPLDDSAESG